MGRAVRAFVALTVLAPFALSCESLLGIDGRYAVEPEPMLTGGAPGAGGSGGGSSGTGGITELSSGGTAPSTGGNSPSETGGASPVDAGCDGASCGEPTPCALGHYKGTFQGEHDPVNIPDLGLFQVSGSIEFDVKADPSGRLGVSGMLLSVQPQPSLLLQFQANIQGELDCGAAKLDAKLTEGKVTPVLLPPFGFEGSLTGAYDSTTHTVSGDWTETQIPATQPTGHGKWTVTRDP